MLRFDLRGPQAQCEPVGPFQCAAGSIAQIPLGPGGCRDRRTGQLGQLAPATVECGPGTEQGFIGPVAITPEEADQQVFGSDEGGADPLCFLVRPGDH